MSGGGAGYLSVATVRRPHGIRGEIVVALETDRPRAVFRPGRELRLGDASGRPVGGSVTVEHPEPDRLRNYRWRARSPQAWTLTGTLNGDPFTASGPFTLQPGDELVVGAGAIVDGHGNTNGTAYTISG